MPDQDQEEVPSIREDEMGVFHLELNQEKIEGNDPKMMALQVELEKKEQEAKKREERYLYLLADFENYKKRVQKEQVEQAKFANEKLLKDVLIVVDDLDRAIRHFKETRAPQKAANPGEAPEALYDRRAVTTDPTRGEGPYDRRMASQQETVGPEPIAQGEKPSGRRDEKSKEARDVEKVVEGFELVSKQFLSFLNRFGVSPIESLNKPFDPLHHQAVGQVERPDLPENHVAEDIQRGYLLYDRLIRPSFVLISKKKSPMEENSPTLGGTVNSSA